MRATGWFLTVTNRAKEAEPFLVDAARHDPRPDSRILLADFYVWSGRDADAVRVLEQVKSTGPSSVVADTRLASIFYRTDRPRAASLVKAVLASHPENADAQLLSAQLAFDDRKLTEAKSAIEALTTQYPRLAASAFPEGTRAAGAWSFQRGSQSLQRGGLLNPRAVPARLYLARLQFLDNKVAAARQIANEVLQLAPGNPAARLTIVQADRASGAIGGRQSTDRRPGPIVS